MVVPIKRKFMAFSTHCSPGQGYSAFIYHAAMRNKGDGNLLFIKLDYSGDRWSQGTYTPQRSTKKSTRQASIKKESWLASRLPGLGT